MVWCLKLCPAMAVILDENRISVKGHQWNILARFAFKWVGGFINEYFFKLFFFLGFMLKVHPAVVVILDF